MKKHVEYIIVGAGPAGLQMGYFLHQAKKDYLILERSDVAGAFFKEFPRHKQLISINKVFTGYDDPRKNLRWDWHSLIESEPKVLFKKYSKKYFPDRSVYVRYLNDFAKKYELKVEYNADVAQISRPEDGDACFQITLASGEEFTCKTLFVATGVSKTYVPDIIGIEHTVNYADVSTKKKDFENKRVLIIGKGNSSLETANHLMESASLVHIASPHPVRMAWRTHYVGHVRAVNNNFLETYLLKSQNGVINGNIVKIDHKHDKYWVTFEYNLASGEVETIEYDEVITATGFRFDASIFDKNCQPKLAIKDRFPEMHSWYESVNIPNLYFIGTIMQQRDFKKKQSGFVHGFRFNVEFLYKYLMQKAGENIGAPEMYPFSAIDIGKRMIARANKSAALWQQDGYYCDLFVFCEESDEFKFYSSVPIDFIRESSIADGAHYFVMTLEFGQDRINKYQNVFAVDRIHKDDYLHSALSTGIHPIIRHYHHHQLMSEHHVLEDFESTWDELVHIDPLLDYLVEELGKIKMESSISTK